MRHCPCPLPVALGLLVCNRRLCSTRYLGPCAALRSFLSSSELANIFDLWSLVFSWSPLSLSANDCIGVKLVPITSSEVITAIIKILFVLFILGVQVLFMVYLK